MDRAQTFGDGCGRDQHARVSTVCKSILYHKIKLNKAGARAGLVKLYLKRGENENKRNKRLFI